MKKNKIYTAEEKLARIEKKQKHKKIRHIIFLFILLILITVGTKEFKKYYPYYISIKKDVFNGLVKMQDDNFKRPGNTSIYDKDNNLIGEIGSEKYEYIKIDKISPYIISGYIDKEDENFYLHHGVDFKALFRAGLAYIKNDGKITQGGSTITQQVIKNNLLSQEQTFERKFAEIYLAFAMEKKYNKAQIMEFYCNSNYYGNGCYGVEGASEYYFGKKCKDISLREASILVATSNSPNVYNPVQDYDLALEQSNFVLQKMYENEDITEDLYNKALKENPKIVKKTTNLSYDNDMISYAIHCAALKYMNNVMGFSFKYTFTSEEEYENYIKKYNEAYTTATSEIRSNGYIIKTSLDSSIQKELQDTIDNDLSGFKEKSEDGIYELQGAGVCVDNKTGLVVAAVGGRSNSGSFNRAFQAVRQSGSTIKPLLDYTPSFNEGLSTPGSIVADTSITVNKYTPQNSDRKYHGNVTERYGLLHSYNIVAFKTFLNTGAETSFSYLDKMKFSTLTYSDMIAPAVALGGFTNGVTVADMAKGYSTLANNGTYMDNDCILSLVDYMGREIYSNRNSNQITVFEPDAAFMTTDILQGYFKESFGAGARYQKTKQYYAGKTGTTNNAKDLWFCGFSKYYSTAVWVGYDTPKSMGKVYGADYPCQIWTNFMDTLHDDKKLDPIDFLPTPTILLSNGKIEKSPEYTENIYKSKPNGYDYISSIIKKRTNNTETLNIDSDDIGTKAAEKFMQYEITKAEDVTNLDSAYNEAITKINDIYDSKLKNQLSEEVSLRYDALKEKSKQWDSVVEADREKKLREEEQKNNQIVSSAGEDALIELENLKKSELQNDIDTLNNCYVKSEYTDIIIKNANVTLSESTNYSWYTSMYNNLQTAINRINMLPTSEEAQASLVDGN